MVRTVPTRGTGRPDYTLKALTEEVLDTPVQIIRQAVSTSLSTVTFDPPARSVLLTNVGDSDLFYERNGDAVVNRGLLERFSAVSLAGQSISKVTFITSSGASAVDVAPTR